MQRLQLLGTASVDQTATEQAGAIPAPRFRSRRTVALLGYLVAERRPVGRDHLAALFWPDVSLSAGRGKLRRELHNLAQVLPQCWETDRHAVAFNPSAETTVDVYQLAELEAEGQWREAAELLNGEFLEGISLDETSEFEHWLLGERERWRERAKGVLRRVIQGHSRRGQYVDALLRTQQLLQFAPWDEDAHRDAMRFLAWTGQRGAALRQFERCRQELLEELAVAPDAETVTLHRQIEAGKLDLPPQLPAFLTTERARHPYEKPLFVGRENELAQLDAFLDTTLVGRGQVVFVTGGPGRGKSALLEAFAQRAMERHPDLLVAGGTCQAFSGPGDPYLPYRDLMGMLTGDVEGQWDAGVITRDHAQRLWAAYPEVVQALLDHGPHLLESFVPGAELLSRLSAAEGDRTPWARRLREHVGQHGTRSEEVDQSHLVQQITDVLLVLSRTRPLILILDDMQWADAASVGLLFHLGRRLVRAGGRLLVLCAYRPEEVATGRDGARHPLAKVLNELKRALGNVWVDLGRTTAEENRALLDGILDALPNRLGEDFRATLFSRTGGHPLFTVELLHGMQERGDLQRDGEARGAWIQGAALDWDHLPARVEAVIEERIDRLDTGLRELLTIASVEGELFTAQAVAAVAGLPEREVLRTLSADLGRRHRLVREQGELETSLTRISRYRFSHALFQQYLYSTLSKGERRALHRALGFALEGLYGEETGEIAPQLARHFQAGALPDKAIRYLLQSGDRARTLYAYQEAIDAYRPAVALLKEQGDAASDRVGRTLMKLGLTYHTMMAFGQARSAYEEAFALWRGVGTGQQWSSTPPAPHALRLIMNTQVTLDPTRTHFADDHLIIKQLFSGLVALSSDLGVVPDVASSWEMLDGGKQYIFHLREDARWSDGAPVTAADFVFAWLRSLDPITDSPNANLFFDIRGAEQFHHGTGSRDQVGVRALDETTLEIELKRATGHFLHLLTGTECCPLPRHQVAEHGEAWTEMDRIVTNGPFRLESWQPGESMVLAGNPDYHGTCAGNVERVALLDLSGLAASSLERYLAGQLEYMEFSRLEVDDWDRVRRVYSRDYVAWPLPTTSFLVFDANALPFRDTRLRRAFVLAIDREVLAEKVLKGFASPATGGFVPLGLPGHSPGIGLPYDPDRARRLLVEAGYAKESGPTFPVVKAVGPLSRTTVMEWLQAQWLQVLGIEIRWEIIDWVTFRDRNRQSEQLSITAWRADYPDPDYHLRLGVNMCRAKWKNQVYGRLVEKARQAGDRHEREMVYRQADKMLVEEAAIVPLFYHRSHALVKPWVEPISALQEGHWKNIIIRPH